MPKVSDYELEHLDDDQFEQKKQKKTKQPKEKKYSDKPNYRKDWKKHKKIEQSMENVEFNEEEDLDMGDPGMREIDF